MNDRNCDRVEDFQDFLNDKIRDDISYSPILVL